MKRLIIGLLTATALSLSAQESAKTPSLERLIALAIKTNQQIEAINAERSKAIGDRSSKSGAMRSAIRILEGKGSANDDLAKINAWIAREEKTLARLKNSKASESFIASVSGRLYEYQLKKKALETNDATAKTGLLEELKAKRTALDEEIATLSKPFHEKTQAIGKKVDGYNAALTKGLEKYVLAPQKAFPGCTTKVHGTMRSAFASADWSNADGKGFAWAHFRIRPPEGAKDARSGKLDDKYPIFTLSDNSVWLWAGPIYIAFISSDKEMRGKETMKTMVKQLIDLEGLSKIVPSE